MVSDWCLLQNRFSCQISFFPKDFRWITETVPEKQGCDLLFQWTSFSQPFPQISSWKKTVKKCTVSSSFMFLIPLCFALHPILRFRCMFTFTQVNISIECQHNISVQSCKDAHKNNIVFSVSVYEFSHGLYCLQLINGLFHKYSFHIQQESKSYP